MSTDFASGVWTGSEKYRGISVISVDEMPMSDSSEMESGKETTTWSLKWDDNGFTGAGWFNDPMFGIRINSREEAEQLHTDLGNFIGMYIAGSIYKERPACATYNAVMG